MIHAAFNQAHLQFSAQWLYDSKQGLCLILCAGLSAAVHVYSLLTSTVVSLRQDQLLSITALCCSQWRRVRKCLCSCFFFLFVQRRAKKKVQLCFCVCASPCVSVLMCDCVSEFSDLSAERLHVCLLWVLWLKERGAASSIWLSCAAEKCLTIFLPVPISTIQTSPEMFSRGNVEQTQSMLLGTYMNQGKYSWTWHVSDTFVPYWH